MGEEERLALQVGGKISKVALLPKSERTVVVPLCGTFLWRKGNCTVQARREGDC